LIVGLRGPLRTLGCAVGGNPSLAATNADGALGVRWVDHPTALDDLDLTAGREASDRLTDRLPITGDGLFRIDHSAAALLGEGGENLLLERNITVGQAIAPARIRAVLHLVERPLPRLAPLHLSTADHAGLGWMVRALTHRLRMADPPRCCTPVSETVPRYPPKSTHDPAH